jgi:hypothetical protein
LRAAVVRGAPGKDRVEPEGDRRVLSRTVTGREGYSVQTALKLPNRRIRNAGGQFRWYTPEEAES